MVPYQEAPPCRTSPCQRHTETPLWTIIRALKPEQLTFANHYLNNNHNALNAYRRTYEECPEIRRVPKGKTELQIQNNFAGRSQYLLKKPLVMAYILKTGEKRKAVAVENCNRTFERWSDNLETISSKAVEDKQYSSAVQAQKILGQPHGHLDRHSTGSARLSDQELCAKLADVLGMQASALEIMLSGKPATVIGITPEK